MIQLNTTQFTWDKDTRTFSTEHSSLGIKYVPNSFALQSQWTGKTVTMTRCGVEAVDGEVQGWRYTNKKHAVHVLIVND